MKKYVTFSHFPPFAHFSIIKLWKLIITVFSSVLQVKIYNDFSFSVVGFSTFFQTWSDVVFRIRAFFFRFGFFSSNPEANFGSGCYFASNSSATAVKSQN